MAQKRTLVLTPDAFKNLQEALELRPTLDRREIAAVSIVLKRFVDKLIIVKDTLEGDNVKEGAGYSSLALRMNRRLKVLPPEFQMPDEISLTSYMKRQVNLVIDIYTELISELDVQGSYTYVEYTLFCENAKLFDDLMVKQEAHDLTRLIAYLRDKIKNDQTNYQKTQSTLLESSGPCLEQAVVNVFAEENLGSVFARMRENTEKEKNELKCREKENEVEQTMEDLCTDIADESRIHQEIEFHLTTTVAELTEKVEFWTNKYNSEVEKLDVDLLQLASRREDLAEKYKSTLTEFTRRQEIIDEMQAIADEQERQYEKFIRETKAAFKIQKWWKNILFKRALKKKNLKKSKSKDAKKPKSKRKNK